MRRALVLLVLLVAAGCGSHAVSQPAPTTSTSLPPVLTGAGGQVIVTDLRYVRYTPNGVHCVTRGPYADVAAGARVVLSGLRHNTAAVTQLGAGTLRDGRKGRKPGCVFEFFASNVPNRLPTFVIYVGDQKPVRVSPAALAANRAVVVITRGR